MEKTKGKNQQKHIKWEGRRWRTLKEHKVAWQGHDRELAGERKKHSTDSVECRRFNEINRHSHAI